MIPSIADLRKKITAILFFLSGLFPALHAQQYYFKHYSVESGLSNNSVVCSLQDKNGFLWFGTINGLNRFDGYSFKIFRHDPEDSISIGSNFIRCLYEDRDGCIWAGTNRGIYVYNTHTEKFSLFSKKDLIEVSDIKEDKQGRLWLISNSNLFRYDPLTHEIKSYPVDSVPGTASSIAIAKDGTIWVSTNSAMLKKYSPATDGFVTYSVLHASGKNPPLRIEKIYSLLNGNLLIGTLTRGVKLFDPVNKTFRDIVSLNPDKTDVYTRDFMQMTENIYWIGTETGIYIYDAGDGTTKRLKKEYDNPYSVSDNVILTFCKDREGGLWIGTYFGGLNYYPNPFTTFQKYFPAYNRPSISGNAVHEICKDGLGNLWVGTEDAGLNKIDLQNNIFTSYKPTGSNTSIAYHNVHGLLVTGDSVWIGTFMHGLDIMNIRTGKVIRHYNAGSAAGDLKNNFIITLYQTHGGDILVGTQNGLFRYNRATDNFSPIPHFNTQIQTLWEDEQGTLWACTRGNGVLYENPFTKQRGSLLYNAHDSNSLVNNYVNGIYEDGHFNLWFATDGGLCYFDKSKNKFTRYTTKNGLPDNLILRILEDESHNLFLSTSKGLVCFNPVNGNIRTYTKSNGLLSDQFNYNSAYKDVDGRMFFGSVKGLISFKPGEFIKNTDIPPVYITGLEVNNQNIGANKPGSLLKESIIYTKNISLPYDQSTISIDFAALSYTVPEMNEYAYKMVGLDKDWTLLKRNRKVYYTKLPPGSYEFRVRGSNSSGIWNTKDASIEIYISPPFWASVWAYIFYTAFILTLAYLLFRGYFNRVNEKNRRKFEILDMEKGKGNISFQNRILYEYCP